MKLFMHIELSECTPRIQGEYSSRADIDRGRIWRRGRVSKSTTYRLLSLDGERSSSIRIHGPLVRPFYLFDEEVRRFRYGVIECDVSLLEILKF